MAEEKVENKEGESKMETGKAESGSLGNVQVVGSGREITTNSSDVITIKKDTLWKYSTYILLAVIIVGGFMWYNGDNANGPSLPTGQVVKEPADAQKLAAPSAPSKVEVIIEGYPIEGEEDAPVTIVEYSDFECPFCGRYYSQTYSLIKKEYIDSGKVKYVFKDFPLSFHQNAQKAAEAAHCAREQKGDEGYWSMHNQLFENQGALGIEDLKKYAAEIGLNAGRFNDCLVSGKMAGIVQKGFNEGRENGVQGTPAFFINGKLLSGAQPFEAFKAAIGAEL